jgi:hypothetical protein
MIRHNNRFNHEGQHPEEEGAVTTTGRAANTLGNQGDTKIRAVPYLRPTNRGDLGDTTFTGGGSHAAQAAPGAEQRMESEWTNMPHMRAESSRMDGGGIEALSGYEAAMQQYNPRDGWDGLPTQRSSAQEHVPNMGPAEWGGGARVLGEVAAPMTTNGTQDVSGYGMGVASGGVYEGAKLHATTVVAPNSRLGLNAVAESTLRAWDSSQQKVGAKLMDARVESFNSKGGLHATTASGLGVSHHAHEAAQLTKEVHSAQYKTKREALKRVQSAFDSALGGFKATTHRSRDTKQSDKRGHLTDFLMPGGNVGGERSPYITGPQGVATGLRTRRDALGDSQLRVKSVAALDGRVPMGQHRAANTREVGSSRLGARAPHAALAHLSSAGMALGMRDDSEALSR